MHTKRESAVLAFGSFFAQGRVSRVLRSFLNKYLHQHWARQRQCKHAQFGQKFTSISGDSSAGFPSPQQGVVATECFDISTDAMLGLCNETQSHMVFACQNALGKSSPRLSAAQDPYFYNKANTNQYTLSAVSTNPPTWHVQKHLQVCFLQSTGLQLPSSGSMTARGSPSAGSMTFRGHIPGLRTEPAGFGYGNNSPSGSMTARRSSSSFGTNSPMGSTTARGMSAHSPYNRLCWLQTHTHGDLVSLIFPRSLKALPMSFICTCLCTDTLCSGVVCFPYRISFICQHVRKGNSISIRQHDSSKHSATSQRNIQWCPICWRHSFCKQTLISECHAQLCIASPAIAKHLWLCS